MPEMEATAGHSKACCNVPPVVATGYQIKGSYEELGGYKTCKFPVPLPVVLSTYLPR